MSGLPLLAEAVSGVGVLLNMSVVGVARTGAKRLNFTFKNRGVLLLHLMGAVKRC